MPAQGHDGLVGTAGAALGEVIGDRPVHQAGGLHEGFLLPFGGRHLHRLEGDEVHALQVGDGRVEVVAEGEVQDGEPVRDALPQAPQGLRLEPAVAPGAADQHVGLGDGAVDPLAAQGQGPAAAVGHEGLRAAGGGVDAHVGGAALGQLRQGGAGIGTGADDQDVGPPPERPGVQGRGAGVQVGREVQGHGDDGPAGRAEGRVGADVLGGARGGLEELDQRSGGGAGLLGRAQGAAHLSGDLALADDGRLQARTDLEEVTDGGVPGHQPEGGLDGADVQSGAAGHGLQQLGAGLLHRGAVRGLGVDLHAVARGQDDGSGGGRRGDGGGDLVGTVAQLRHRVEVKVGVRGNQGEKRHNAPDSRPGVRPGLRR